MTSQSRWNLISRMPHWKGIYWVQSKNQLFVSLFYLCWQLLTYVMSKTDVFQSTLKIWYLRVKITLKFETLGVKITLKILGHWEHWILMKLFTNYLEYICECHFSRFLKFQIWWRHSGHFALTRCGTLMVACLVRCSSNFNTRST